MRVIIVFSLIFLLAACGNSEPPQELREALVDIWEDYSNHTLMVDDFQIVSAQKGKAENLRPGWISDEVWCLIVEINDNTWAPRNAFLVHRRGLQWSAITIAPLNVGYANNYQRDLFLRVECTNFED